MSAYISEKKIREIILLLAVVSTYGFNCIYFQNNTVQSLLYISCFIITFLFIINRKKLKGYIPLQSLSYTLLLYPIFSFFITSFLYNPGSWGYYKYRVISQAFFLLFFLYHIWNVKEKALIQALTSIGLIVFFIQIIQQFIPDSAIFGINDMSNIEADYSQKVEIRNGLYRYRLMSVYFISMLCTFYYWQQILLRKSRTNLLLFCIFLLSTYLFLTRQIIFSVGISLLLSFFLTKNKRAKKWSVIGAFCIAILLYLFYDSIFGSLMSQTHEELNDSNIRLTCLTFYWEKITNSPLTILLGNGFPSSLIEWQKTLRLTPSDIGIVGECFYYGVIWIIIYLYTLYIFFFRYKKIIPLYIKLFFLSTFIISIMIFPYRSCIEFLIWSSVLYICSIYIKNNKKNA